MLRQEATQGTSERRSRSATGQEVEKELITGKSVGSERPIRPRRQFDKLTAGRLIAGRPRAGQPFRYGEWKPKLPDVHRDPFDCLLICEAICNRDARQRILEVSCQSALVEFRLVNPN